MKKIIRVLTLTLAFAVLCGSFATIVYAKELEPCRLCGGKGDYHCIACGNTGTVICDGCGGAGGSKCQGDTYKGNSCDNGYYTCNSCNGDGKNRSGDGKIIEGVCGNCGGAGKLRCVVCNNGTPGWNACTGCGGSGNHECQVGTCKVSRQYGWRCPDCKGTGFILVGNLMPPKENNDGVRNVPVKGDYIVTNDKTWAGYTYGGESSSDNGNIGNQDNNNVDNNIDGNVGNSENDANQEGKYIVWFGEGSWKIGDVTVTVDKTDIQYLTENDIITLKNFDADTMEVRVEAENGFRTTLVVKNGKTSISANTNNGPIAIDITFSVVAKEVTPDGNKDGKDEPIIAPSDRNQDFEISPSESTDAKQPASATVLVGKMTSEEQKHYVGLTDEELNRKLVNVQSILQTVRPGEFATDTKKLINDVVKYNDIDTLEEAKIFPLSFEGHEDLGFPIAVTVRLEKGMLEGSTNLFIYHILEDKSIESLGKAEYTTYDDGSVESITFYTTGFSSFFTSSKELDTDIPAASDNGELTDNESPSFFWLVLVAVLTSVVAVLVVVTIVLRKKRKKV